VKSRESLVDENRLSRAWEVVTSRVSGLDGAVPDAYIQREEGKHPIAVFHVAEANPRHFGTLQVSAVHMILEGWREMEKETEHYVSQGFDPLQWCLLQAAKGHLHTMNNLRQMSHGVTRINERGELETTYPTGH
jgi:hypothetical protein